MGARGPLSKRDLKLAPDLTVVGPDDAVPETAAAKVKPEAPAAPADLPLDLSIIWDEITESLEEAGMIAKCDGLTLELALRHFVAARKASNELLDQSVVKEDKKNQRAMKNPASQVFRDHSAAFLEYAKQLGLTFVSRARTPVPDGTGGNGGNPFT